MHGEEAAIIASAVVVSLLGIGFAMLASSLARRAVDVVSIVAGVAILLVAVLHFAPEILLRDSGTQVFLAGGVLFGVLLEIIMRMRKDTDTPGAVHAAARIGLLILGVHSLLDGAVYTAAFWHDHDTGMLAAFGLVMHEAPEGAVAVMLALQSGLRRHVAVIVAVLASTVTTPLGWGLAHLIGSSAHGAMQAMFAASAGLLLYAGWHLMSGGWRSMQKRVRDRA